MTDYKKPTGRASSIPAALAMGGFCSLIMILLGSGILAKLIETERISESGIGYGIMILLILSAYLSSMLSCKIAKRQRLLVCMATGGIQFLILLSITALFFGGQYSAVGVTALLIFCGSGLAVLTGNNRNRAGKPKIRPTRL